MQDYTITGEQLQAFRQRLVWEEKSPATIEKYLRDAAAFTAWLDGRAASKAAAGAWKAALLEAKLAPATINVKLAAVNRFLVFLGWPAFRVKPLRIQRRLFRDDSRELTRPEYLRLLETARTQGRERLALLLETICGTGIRVSEVRYVTEEGQEIFGVFSQVGYDWGWSVRNRTESPFRCGWLQKNNQTYIIDFNSNQILAQSTASRKSFYRFGQHKMAGKASNFVRLLSLRHF